MFLTKPFKILRTVIKHLCLFLIRSYQTVVSVHLGGACRFEPSCSIYAAEAFEKHDLLTALQLTTKRVSKCHPLGPFGFDPVPDKK